MSSAAGPLSGIRILECCWVMAGPIAGRSLADYGAEVIKIENFASMDNQRNAGPWLHGLNTAPDGGGRFELFNRNKLSANLNLRHEEGKRIFLALVQKSDVVIDNFSASVMQRLGFGYDVLSQINPGIVVVQMSGMGQTGPYAPFVSHGPTVQALSGFYALTESDGVPMNTGYTYADFAGGIVAAFAVGCALVQKTATGRGSYVDLSQFEVMASLLGESLVEAGRSDVVSVHEQPLRGVFACLEDDTWLAIDANSPNELRNLASVINKSAQPIVTEQQIREWATGIDVESAATLLQAVGVPSARVQSIADLVELDPHMAARRHFRPVPHFLGDDILADTPPARLSATPGDVQRPAPSFGGNSDYVYREILGLTAADYARLREIGAIS